MKQSVLNVALACLFVTGCASTNFSSSTSPATVREEWIRNGITVWGGTKLFAVGDLEFGYHRYENDTTFTVDPGRKRVKVYYYANRGNAQGLFWQTDIASFDAELKPNGRYQVRGTYGETKVQFRLIDLDTQQVVVESEEFPIIRRPSMAEPSPVMIPIFIPSR
ncbi:MAG: hypothetical protein KBD60_11920 [Sterolibacterium sp.]|nr:hypothetical protein [Sterolibacterium sp.]